MRKMKYYDIYWRWSTITWLHFMNFVGHIHSCCNKTAVKAVAASLAVTPCIRCSWISAKICQFLSMVSHFGTLQIHIWHDKMLQKKNKEEEKTKNVEFRWNSRSENQREANTGENHEAKNVKICVYISIFFFGVLECVCVGLLRQTVRQQSSNVC